ncbi:MAG: hypothetical protein K8R40_11305 [Anaerolineaceae bacterium]|nr:hypothetical protein [Anaerolineaceae bacterium]
MKTGLVGWFFFLTFLITYIVDGFKKWRSINDIHLQSIFLGSTLAGLSILLASILHPIIMTIFWTPLIGIMIGINSVILNLNPSAETTTEETISPNVLPQEL